MESPEEEMGRLQLELKEVQIEKRLKELQRKRRGGSASAETPEEEIERLKLEMSEVKILKRLRELEKTRRPAAAHLRAGAAPSHTSSAQPQQPVPSPQAALSSHQQQGGTAGRPRSRSEGGSSKAEELRRLKEEVEKLRLKKEWAELQQEIEAAKERKRRADAKMEQVKAAARAFYEMREEKKRAVQEAMVRQLQEKQQLMDELVEAQKQQEIMMLKAELEKAQLHEDIARAREAKALQKDLHKQRELERLLKVKERAEKEVEMKLRLELAAMEGRQEDIRNAQLDIEGMKYMETIDDILVPAPWDDHGSFESVNVTLIEPGPLSLRTILEKPSHVIGRRATARLRTQPFGYGGVRICWHMKLFGKRWVAKKYIKKSKWFSIDENVEEMHTTAVAKFISEEFNKKRPLDKIPVPEQNYIDALVVRMDDNDPPDYMMIEPMLDGKFVKMNGNNGYVNRDAPFDAAHALSHFSHKLTGGKLMLVDVQGVPDTEEYVLTDPAMHTNPVLGYFGCTDCGAGGMKDFFDTHRCNDVCRFMRLC